jgi:DNA (cytosine-5)-methyltransferase 1
VFVVGCLGDGAAAAQVLFERESVQRDSSSRRTPGQGASADAEGCAGTVSSKWAKGTGGPAGDECYNLTTQPTVWPANCAGTLGQSASGTGSPGYSNQEIFSQNAANLIPQPIPFTKAKRAQSVTDDETWVDGQVNPTLSLFDQGDTRATTVAVGFNWQNGGGYGNANDGLGITVEGTGPLQRCNTPAVAFQQNQLGEVRCGNIAGTVNTNSNASGRNTPMVAHAVKVGSGIDIPSPPAVACCVAPTITAGNDPSRSPQSSEVTQQVAAVHAASMTVRRLTARECERLQAFPDDYTLIPWRKKQAEDCPDGPRYKALGNSMAVNCMAWIGERIAALENNR